MDTLITAAARAASSAAEKAPSHIQVEALKT